MPPTGADAILRKLDAELAQAPLEEEIRLPPKTFRQSLNDLFGGVITVRDTLPYMEALVHKSAEAKFGYCQERLEFVGDALLYAAVAVIFHTKFTLADEKSLTKLRTKIVNGAALSSIGKQLHVENLIVRDQSCQLFDKCFEDTVEALLGAVHLDLGFDAVTQVVRYWIGFLDQDTLYVDTNYKEVLRRFAIRSGLPLPEYKVTFQTGQHVATVTVGLTSAEGAGPQRRTAEWKAAENLLHQLGYSFDESVL